MMHRFFLFAALVLAVAAARGQKPERVEVSGPRIPLGEIPKLTVTFSNLRVNEKPVKVAWADAVYPKNVPDYADVTNATDALVVKVGQSVENRKARRARLMGPRETSP